MDNFKSLSNVSLIVLHLLPGVLFFIGFLPLVLIIHQKEIPILFAIVIAVIFLVIPYEWAFLLWQGERSTGRLILRGVVDFLEPIPLMQYFFLVPTLVIWSFLVAGALMLLFENSLRVAIFNSLPAGMDITSMDNVSSYDLWILFFARLLILGIIAPVTEELYFRGYLLPRMERWNGWSPLIHSVLFSLQHFLEPYAFLSRLIAFLPVALLVQRKRNIYIAIFYHVLMNILSTLSMLPILLRK